MVAAPPVDALLRIRACAAATVLRGGLIREARGAGRTDPLRKHWRHCDVSLLLYLPAQCDARISAVVDADAPSATVRTIQLLS